MPWLRRSLVVLLLSVLVWQSLKVAFPQQESSLRSHFRASLEELFPQLAKQAKSRFGLIRLHHAAPGKAEVILVHGLDDPGKVWMNLAPVLAAKGYGVSAMEYPNDQPIRQSAKLLRATLQDLARQSFTQVSIVAHSMGGLVSREMLTNPSLACDSVDCQRVGVDKLIMVGTPNNGSQLARFRALGEVREHVSRLISGNAHWLDWIYDGAGEAGVDLVPGSDFLNQLNARTHSTEASMVVIAGVVAKEQIEHLNRMLSTAGGGGFDVVPVLGDMLVSLSSAKLDSVPLYRVSGNHLSIIRNISKSSERIPPAIPLILRLLEE